MKVSEIEPGEIFMIGPTLTRPALKLKEGFLDMVSRYVYVCWNDSPATVLTESQIRRLRSNWKMSEEDFERFKQALIEIYSNK